MITSEFAHQVNNDLCLAIASLSVVVTYPDLAAPIHRLVTDALQAVERVGEQVRHYQRMQPLPATIQPEALAAPARASA
jgi:hypothetical protein